MALTISLGSNSLSSSSVYKISIGVAQVKTDSYSAVERFSTQNPKIAEKKSSSLTTPQDLTMEELRASSTVLLNKLLLSLSSSTILPVKISESLNSNSSLDFSEIDLTEEECHVLENSYAPLIGICSVIEHKSSSLSKIVDAVDALSCEAMKADVTSFTSLDSQDRDAIEVANHLKFLLNGSNNLIFGEEIEAVSKIPIIHGTFHDIVKDLHARIKVELNSRQGNNVEALGTRFLALSRAIKDMGKFSFSRAKKSFETIENEDLRNDLSNFLRNCCLDYEILEDVYKEANNALVVDEDYCKFAHLVNESLGILYKIVSLEAFAAFFNLKGEELFNEIGEGNEEEPKEKRVVLGKGTSILVQLIKERLLCEDRDEWLEKFLFLLNPEDPVFTCFLEKVKEIVESSENRRDPKLLKVKKKSLLVSLSRYWKKTTATKKKKLSLVETIA